MNLRLVLFFALLISGLEAQSITVCSEAGNATCLENNTICLNYNDTEESCSSCIAGFIDFVRYNSTKGCQNITELTWDEFVELVEPVYKDMNDTLEMLRLEQLHLNLQFISEHRAQIPPAPYELDVNEFSAHLLIDHKTHAGTVAIENAASELGFGRFVPEDTTTRRTTTLPPSVDWEELGGTTDVKNQGQCGCCWAISCAGAVEGATFVTDNEFIESLSFQQLTSCDTTNDGCNGGDIAYAMQYSVSNSFGGLANLNDYPFADADGTTTTQCELAGKNLSVAVYQPTIVVAYNDQDSFDDRVSIFQSAVAQQPVSISMDSNCTTFQNYAGGVMTDDGGCACADTSCIDHSVLLVGYNNTNSPPYWHIKNSWGTAWGESGYFRVSQEGGGDWGLFGLLGEGVIALKATNTSAEESSAVVTRVGLAVWAVVSLVLGSLLA